MDNIECLCDGHPSLVLGQSVQSLQNRLDFLLTQQFLCEFFYNTWSPGEEFVKGGYLLNRPSLICFVAMARTDNNSTIILTMISVISWVGGILV